MNSKLWAVMPAALNEIFEEREKTMQNFALLNSFIRQDKTKEMTVRDGVAVINIENAVYRRKPWFAQGVSHKQIKDEISKALQDEKVTAILYNIYSPGGTVAGTQELASYIKEASSVKPSCAFVDGMCCSAAYWLASATGKIFATESAEIGSVGVVLMHSDYSKFNENMGLKYTYITAGSKKSIGASEIPLSEEDKAYLQHNVDAVYAVFLHDVAQNMDLDTDKKLEWADGRVFLGNEALRLGLVSRLVKTQEEAIALLSENKENKMSVPNTSQNHEQPQTAGTVSAIDENLMAIIETVCGAENAQKVKQLAQANVTKEQMQALGNVFQSKKQDGEQEILITNKQILNEIMQAGSQAVSVSPDFSVSDEDALIQRIGNYRG